MATSKKSLSSGVKFMLLVVLFITGLGLYIGGSILYQHVNIVSTGVKTTATVVDKSRSKPTLSFRTLAGETYIVQHDMGYRKASIGATLPIYYNISNPNDIVVDNSYEIWGFPLLIISISIIFLAVMTALLTGRFKWRFKTVRIEHTITIR
jgi:hypothetical protein